jgi:uncharacterized membrane protein
LRPNSEEGNSFDKKRYALMQSVLSKTLLYGVVVSTIIIVMGLVTMAVTNRTGYVCDASGDSLNCLLNYNANTIPHGDYPNSLPALISGLEQGKSFAIIQLGVIVLLATPVIRVTASLALFAIENDRPFVLITLFVLLILLFSFFIVPEIPLFKA